ncbi:phage head morphogenesis protein [Profundibacter sp.]
MADPTDKPSYAFNPGPPPEASRFLRNKSLRPSFHWEDVEPEEHAVAFTVAKATQVDVLETIREEVQRAIDEGVPFAKFQKTLRPRLEKLGWWGKAEMVDPLTGEKITAQLGSPRRLRTIYRANLRSARAAGQWERIQRSKKRLPYLEYRLGPSERHRPHHAAKEYLVLPADDPFWSSWYPPNGWGCKCWVRQLTQRGAEKRGISESPELPMRDVFNKRTGEIKRVPVGIDPGWEQNPGLKRLQAMEARLAEKLDSSDPDIARAAARDIATSWRIERLMALKAVGDVPIGLLSHKLAGDLKLDTRVITYSDKSAHHMFVEHHDRRKGDLVHLADAESANRIALQTLPNGNRKLTLEIDSAKDLRAAEDYQQMAMRFVITLKKTGANFVTTMHRTSRRRWEALIKREGVEVIKDTGLD